MSVALFTIIMSPEIMQLSGSHPNPKIVHPFRPACLNEAMALFHGAIRYAVPIKKSVHLCLFSTYFCSVLFFGWLLIFVEISITHPSNSSNEKKNCFPNERVRIYSFGTQTQRPKINHQTWSEKSPNTYFSIQKKLLEEIVRIYFASAYKRLSICIYVSRFVNKHIT